MILSRREWHRLTVAALAAGAARPFAQAAQPRSSAEHRGVTLGVQSYSFRDRPLDAALTAMREVGLSSCELWQGHVEPRDVSRDALRRWRETVALDEFRKLREKFTSAGIAISAYNISFNDSFSDAEIERGFEMAKALGTDVITASANIATVARIAPAAARHKIPVAMHNHSNIQPNEFATPDNFTTALTAGPLIAVNLDIGHFTAANFDAVDFLRAHHDRILSLHIKDRKRDNGPNVPFGQGDSPIGTVLRLLRDRRWQIPANIEYEYKGADTVAEVKRCLEFCRRELDA